MSQKIWVIDDRYENVVSTTPIPKRDDISPLPRTKTRQRNPALAFSLSLLIWGCGHFYNRQWRIGILFLLLMVNFYLFTSGVIMYWEPIKTSLEPFNVNYSETLLLCGFFYLSGLIIWLLNAWQAYFMTLKSNAKSFKGIKIMLLPVVCSLLMPGWGQLLNGQTKKGLFFHMFALAGLAVFPAILTIFLAWQTLEASRAQSIVEWIFSICIILAPFILLMWLISIFDAAKVSINKLKREPFQKRTRYAINRFRSNIRIYGRKNAMLPLIKRMVLVTLLLILCVISYQYFPEKYYVTQLQNLGNRMSQKEMTVLPNLVKKLLNNISIGE